MSTLRPRGRPLLNGLCVAAAVVFAAGIVWEILHPKRLPPTGPALTRSAPANVGASSTPVSASDGVAVDATVITAVASRNLFNAARSESATVAAPTAAGPKPVLHGVVMDGVNSRAYVEDPVAKRIFGYAVGDTVGGGRLEVIADDRIAIRRPEGLIEVLLPESAKSRQASAAPAAPRPTTAAAAPAPAVPNPAPPTPPASDKPSQ